MTYETLSDSIAELKKKETTRKKWAIASTILLTIVLVGLLAGGVSVVYSATRLPKKTIDCAKNTTILSLTSDLDSSKSRQWLTRKVTLGNCDRIGQEALQSSLNALAGNPFSASSATLQLTTCPASDASTTSTTAVGTAKEICVAVTEAP